MIPHVTHYDEADITELEAFRKRTNEEHAKEGVKLTMVALLLKACVGVAAARSRSSTPRSTATTSSSSATTTSASRPTRRNGLVVPVIRDVDQKGLLDIARELTELSAQARDGKLEPADMQGGTFTISRLGGIGGTAFTPIINAPEVAILGVAKSAMKPVWNGQRVRAAADGAAVALLRPPRDRRRAGRALRAHLARRARRPAQGAAVEERPWPTARDPRPGHRRLRRRPDHRAACGARATRCAGGSARHARVRQGDDGRPAPQAGMVRELKVAVGDTVSEGTVILVLEGAAADGCRAGGRRAAEEQVVAPAADRADDRRASDGSSTSRSACRTSATSPTCRSSRSSSRPATGAVEDPLITLESDKATMDVPSPAAGTVEELAVAVGDTVSEGSLILTLEGVAADGGRARGAAEAGGARVAPPAPASRATVDVECDVVVLGAGPGGYTAAFRAADLGLKTHAGRALRAPRRRLPERRLHPVQGAAARRARCIAEAEESAAHGITFGEPQIDLDALRAWKESRRRQAHRRPRRPGQAAQGQGRARRRRVHVAATS